ncbi:unnamed protein product [Gongylonema pulchrum]|uniref:ZCCHC11 n=1 Tax=Gongylonema pulchrum TaxID=637853 RepID=A0A183D2T2_9BILA|nr:unnamed protein product [Gongylonema pulchrum]
MPENSRFARSHKKKMLKNRVGPDLNRLNFSQFWQKLEVRNPKPAAVDLQTTGFRTLGICSDQSSEMLLHFFVAELVSVAEK